MVLLQGLLLDWTMEEVIFLVTPVSCIWIEAFIKVYSRDSTVHPIWWLPRIGEIIWQGGCQHQDLDWQKIITVYRKKFIKYCLHLWSFPSISKTKPQNEITLSTSTLKSGEISIRFLNKRQQWINCRKGESFCAGIVSVSIVVCWSYRNFWKCRTQRLVDFHTSRLSLVFTHFEVCDRISLLFKAERYSIVCMYHILLNPLSHW